MEDKVLEVLDEALEKDQPVIAKTTLENVRTHAQKLHDEMKVLQAITKH